MHPVDILPIAFAAIVFGVLVLNLGYGYLRACLLYTSPSPRDSMTSRMPSSA